MTAFASSSRRRPALVATAAATAALAASLGLAASATAAPLTVVPRGAGLSGPTAALQTPDGARWVADGALGVCRVADDGAALVHDVFCSEAELEPHAGPIEGTGLAFDPVTSNFYSGDLQSNFGSVWRLHWNAATGRIDAASKIVDLAGDRLTGLAMRPATDTEPAALAYVTKRSASVRWLADPSSGPQVPSAIGAARRESPAGVAVLDGQVYVAEGSGVTRMPVGGRAGTAAVEVPGTAGLASSALAADPERHRLYIGTSTPELMDDVVVLDTTTGAVETYESRFTGVTGLGIGDGGDLLVTDDPGLAAGNIDSLNQGRLFRVPLTALRRTRTTITSAPDAWSRATSVTFAYASSVNPATFECRLDTGAWTPCDATTTLDDLAEGSHAFEVRAVTDVGPGPSARRVFVLDRTAPAVAITSPGATVERGSGRVDMVANELAVRFACEIDGGAPVPCEAGEALPALALGEHSVRVTATDAAGNVGASATRAFTVVAPTPVPVPTPAPTPVPTATPSASPSPSTPPVATPQATPEPTTPAAEVPNRRDGEVLAAVARSAPRISVLRVNPNRVSARRGLRTVKLSFVLTGDARTARVTILAAGPERRVLERDVMLGPEGEQLVTLKLTHRERLRPGSYRVTVTARGEDGPASNRGDHRLRIRG